MKKTATISILLLLITALLAGCGSGDKTPDTSGEPTDSQPTASQTGLTPTTDPSQPQEQTAEFIFETSGLSIRFGENAAPIIRALGEPQNYFESPSCAFDGIDKIYYYNGFELFTFPKGDEDFVLSVNLTDDSVTTKEGIYLGMTLEKVIAAYGEDFDQNFGQYTYTRGGATLSFLIEDNKIVVITYTYIT